MRKELWRIVAVAGLVLGLLIPSHPAHGQDSGESDDFSTYIRDVNQPLAPMWFQQSPTIGWWAQDYYRWAKEYNLNPNVIATIAQIESCGAAEPKDPSDRTTAQGQFQVMPFNYPADFTGYMQDPEINAQMGIQYINYTLDRSGGDLLVAFAAYNGGPSVISKPFSLWRDETQRYYDWAKMVGEAFAGASYSQRLEDWLKVDGLVYSQEESQGHQGSLLVAKLAEPVEFTSLSLYLIMGADSQYLVEFSDDGSVWTDAGKLLPTQAGWNELKWESRGAHMHWRLRLIKAGFVKASVTEMRWNGKPLEPESLTSQGFYSFNAVAAFDGDIDDTAWRAFQLGRFCSDADQWQIDHPRDDKTGALNYTGVAGVSVRGVSGHNVPGVIVIDWPPSVWVIILLVIGGLWRRWIHPESGVWIINAVTVLAIGLWFPLNLLSRTEREYTNPVFELRQIVARSKEADELFVFILEAKKRGLPTTRGIDVVLAQYERYKVLSEWVDRTARWFTKDPIFTPLVHGISEWLWTELNGMQDEFVVVAPYELVAPFDVPVQVRQVVDTRGATNGWGIHGNLCFSCINAQSWLGTDIDAPDGTPIKAFTDGYIERVILGGEAVGGASVWIVGNGIRYSVLHLNSEDAGKWTAGDRVTAGQTLGRFAAADGHFHVTVELQNPDGSWGDYPFIFVLRDTEVSYSWYDRRFAYTDLYVPTEAEVLDRSAYLNPTQTEEKPDSLTKP